MRFGVSGQAVDRGAGAHGDFEGRSHAHREKALARVRRRPIAIR